MRGSTPQRDTSSPGRQPRALVSGSRPGSPQGKRGPIPSCSEVVSRRSGGPENAGSIPVSSTARSRWKHPRIRYGGAAVRVRAKLAVRLGRVPVVLVQFPILDFVSTGCGSIWLEHCVRDAGIAGSNPVTPTVLRTKPLGAALPCQGRLGWVRIPPSARRSCLLWCLWCSGSARLSVNQKIRVRSPMNTPCSSKSRIS